MPGTPPTPGPGSASHGVTAPALRVSRADATCARAAFPGPRAGPGRALAGSMGGIRPRRPAADAASVGRDWPPRGGFTQRRRSGECGVLPWTPTRPSAVHPAGVQRGTDSDNARATCAPARGRHRRDAPRGRRPVFPPCAPAWTPAGRGETAQGTRSERRKLDRVLPQVCRVLLGAGGSGKRGRCGRAPAPREPSSAGLAQPQPCPWPQPSSAIVPILPALPLIGHVIGYLDSNLTN